MFQNLRPLGSNVWIKCIEQDTRTAGGLYIPDSAKNEAQTGIVMAVGTGNRNDKGEIIPMNVAVGDTVFFGKYAGTKAGDSFLVIKEQDILGIVENK
jgi:chaperonin GroES